MADTPETPIAIIRKNSREEIRVALVQFNGHDLFNIRVWFKGEDGDMRPGKNGVAVKVALLPDFADAVSLALEKARGLGLCD